MKDKIITLFLIIIMLMLLGIIGILGIVIYSDLTEGTTDTVYVTGEISEEIVVKEEKEKKSLGEKLTSLIGTEEAEEIEYTPSASAGNYFYEQLNEYEKIIYNGLQENKENLETGTYIINYGDKFSDVLQQEDGNEILGQHYQSAVEAFLHDNMDIFYLDINKLYLNIQTTTRLTKKTYNVFIGPANNSTYYYDEFTSKEQVEIAKQEIENEKNAIISSLKGSQYKQIMQIHDYLVDNIEYDSSYVSSESYTMYGALIKGTCVCEGYAESFKYLANSIGIECEIVQGQATNSSNKTENHAWNIVNLNGTWYLVDATWDDPIIIGNGYVTKDIKYKYFLKGTDTFNKDHVMEYQFSEGGKTFKYPEISTEDY